MNPELPKNPREELELRLTALLLGELSATEAAAVRAAIAKDPELKKLHDDLKRTIRLVRVAATSSEELLPADIAQLKLSEERRKKLLTAFAIPPLKKQDRKPKAAFPLRLVEVLAVLAFLALLAAMLLPSLSKAKSKAQRVTIQNNVRQLEMAKQMWADDHKKSPGDAPTMEDLRPYLGGRGELPIIAGETYALGKVGERVAAESDGDRVKVTFGRQVPMRGSGDASGKRFQSYADANRKGVSPPAPTETTPLTVTVQGDDNYSANIVGYVGNLDRKNLGDKLAPVARKEVQLYLPSYKATPDEPEIAGVREQPQSAAQAALTSQSSRELAPLQLQLPAPALKGTPGDLSRSDFGVVHAGVEPAGERELTKAFQPASAAGRGGGRSGGGGAGGMVTSQLRERFSQEKLAAKGITHGADGRPTSEDKLLREEVQSKRVLGYAKAATKETEDKAGKPEYANQLSVNAGVLAATAPAAPPVADQLNVADFSAVNGVAQERLARRDAAPARPATPSAAPVAGDEVRLGSFFRSQGGSAGANKYFDAAGFEVAPATIAPSQELAFKKDGDADHAFGESQGRSGGSLNQPQVTNAVALNDWYFADRKFFDETRKATEANRFVGRSGYMADSKEQFKDAAAAEARSKVDIVLPKAAPEKPGDAEGRTSSDMSMSDRGYSAGEPANVPTRSLRMPKGGAVTAGGELALNKTENRIRELQQQTEQMRKNLDISDADALGVLGDVPPIRKPATNAPIPQPEFQTAENNFSTFSLNVSDVSFNLTAASLEKGQMPDPASIRSEEFINAFDYRDPEPPAGAPIAFAWERVRYPFAHNRDLLRFSLKTAAEGRQAGRPLNIVLLLDNSGSMERADRVRIIREALRVLASQLQPQDKLSVITFSRTPRLFADGVSGDKAGEITDQVSGLTPQGGTNLEDAMNLAYQTALRHYLANGINRVVLLTDGAANLGNVEPESLKQKVEAHRTQGIALDCFGIGWEGFNDDLLEVLSRNGDGRYGFINSPEEATTDFAGQLAGALKVAASDVKVQVEFNPMRVTAFRQIGYAKHQLTKEQFRDNTVDAAEIAAQEAGNALYTVEVNPAGEGPLCTLRVRYKIPGTTDYREQSWDVPYTGNALSLEQSSPAMRLAATSSAFSEWLVASPFAGEVTPDRLLGYLSGVPEVYGVDSRPKKLEWMIRQAKSIAAK